MKVLAFILVTLSWPVVTFVSVAVFQSLLLPVFDMLLLRQLKATRGDAEDGPSDSFEEGFARAYEKTDLSLANLFLIAALTGSQIVAVLAGKGIFALFGFEATRWIILPLGIWCLAFAFPRFGVIGGRVGRHVSLCFMVGLPMGLAAGTFWFL